MYRKIAATLILKHEGLRRKPYVDTVGKITIGYGRNLSDVGISVGEAALMFENDLNRAITTAQDFIGPQWSELNDSIKAVLIDMAFNLGAKLFDFKKFKKALLSGDYQRAADEMLDSKWAEQVKRRATELAEIVRNCT